MLKGKRREQTATFLEGLNGHYERRDSPPPMPNTTNICPFQNSSRTGSSTKSLQATGLVQNPSIASSNLSVPKTLPATTYQTEFAPFNGHPKPSVSSISLPMAGLVPGINYNNIQPNSYKDQKMQQQRRLSHTPRGSRTISSRSELSSHSFSSSRQNNVQLSKNRQVYVQNTIQSSQRYSALNEQTKQKRSLTSSLSNNNIQNKTKNDILSEPPSTHGFLENFDAEEDLKNFKKSGSFQSLRNQNSTFSQQRDSASPSLSVLINPDVHELPLPTGWDVDVTAEGYKFFIDHNNQRTTWIHPLAVESLPCGWSKIFDSVHGVVYYNESEQRSQFEHPGMINLFTHSQTSQKTQPFYKFHKDLDLLPHRSASAANCKKQQRQTQHQQLAKQIQESASLQSIVEHHKIKDNNSDFDTIYPEYTSTLNIINEEIPEWIRLYGKAPFHSDHLLKWSMFKLPQLQQYDRILRKLYKQEVLNTVSKYERVRGEINKELLKRYKK